MHYRMATFEHDAQIIPNAGPSRVEVRQGDGYRVLRVGVSILQLTHPEHGTCVAHVSDVSLSEFIDNTR